MAAVQQPAGERKESITLTLSYYCPITEMDGVLWGGPAYFLQVATKE